MTAAFNRLSTRLGAGVLGLGMALTVCVVGAGPASAADATVPMGTASSFGVLAGSTITNSGNSVVEGQVSGVDKYDIGVSVGTAITGFAQPGGPGIVVAPGVQHTGTDGVVVQAKIDLSTAYVNAAGRTAPADPQHSGLTEIGGDASTPPLAPGIYQGGALQLTGTVTLDNTTDPDAVFVFQADSTLTTAADSVVAFTNKAHASCNVFWKVGTSATLGARTAFAGHVLAAASIDAGDAVRVDGSLLAGTGAVTLLNDHIVQAKCADAVVTTSSSPPATTSGSVVATIATTAETSPTKIVTTTGSKTKPLPTTTPKTTAKTTALTTNVRSAPRSTPPAKERVITTVPIVTSGVTVISTFDQPSVTGSALQGGSVTSSTPGMAVEIGGPSGPTSTTPTAANGTPSLAVTGAQHTTGLAVAGLLAVFLGAGILVFGRRRQPRTGQHI